VAVILSAAIATPVFAQEAVQEPGVQAFYQNLGGRIPIERDGERHGVDTQQLEFERSGETRRGEALHHRSQDVTGPRQQVGPQSSAKGGPNGPPFPFSPTRCSEPIAWAATNYRAKKASQPGADG
jgi:hypothetical protein